MTVSGSIRHIIKRDGTLVPYDRDRISTAVFRAMGAVGKGTRAQAEAVADVVEQAVLAGDGEAFAPSVEDIQDQVEKTLADQGHVETARAYMIYRQQRAQARAARAYSFEVSDNIPYKKIYEVLRWNMDHDCLTLQDLNTLMMRGRFASLVRDSDRRYEDEIGQCAAQILERLDDVRLVIVSGPSSSGKTTTTLKISERLQRAGVLFKALTLDNYFFDLERHPRDQFGDYDYEAPEALDLALIDDHLQRLLKGETVKTPYYNFKTGKRALDVIEFSLAPNEILLLDSLHGLYEPMTRSVPAQRKFRLYIETLGQLRAEDGQFMRWADNRLLRRMIRDSLHRNSGPDETLTHWHYVRRSELKYIIPFIRTADFLVNSALPYEMPILKAKLFHHFPLAEERYRAHPHRQDAYIRARRILDMLEPLAPMADDTGVPPQSLLREFIGGSSYG